MSSRFFSRVASSGVSSGAFSLSEFFGNNLYEEGNPKIKTKTNNILNQEDIDSRKRDTDVTGVVIIGVDRKIYSLPKDFVDAHPGGSKILQSANGYNVAKVWENKQYNFHINPSDERHSGVQEYLDSYFIGNTSSPFPDMPESKLTVSAFKIDPKYYNLHNKYNIEAKELSFNLVGETKYFFIRDHGEYDLDNQDLKISLGDNKSITLNNELLREYPQESIFQPIICAGSGRSKFDCKTNGTQWGGGADAIGTMRVKGTSINKLLDLSYMQPEKPCLMIVTGSDGYDAAVHSDEFDRFYITTRKENGDDLPEIHGRERRLIGDGVPGFRNIKSASDIRFIPELTKEQLAKALEPRLKKPINEISSFLSETNMQILAACPNYDAYLLKDVNTKEVYGFNAYFPVSVKINSASSNIIDGSNIVKASGVAFSGESLIKKVKVCITDSQNNKICKKANIALNKGNSRFVFWEAQWGDELKSINIEEPIVTAVAVDSNKSRSQENRADNNNNRGLYFYASQQEAKVKVNDSSLFDKA